MKTVYNLLDKIKDQIRGNGITNTVTYGDILEVDLNKTTIFPLSHLMLGNVSFSDHIINSSISILFLDIVDDNKNESAFDSFYGTDDLQDVMNTQLQAVNDLQSHLRRGDLFKDVLQIVGDATAEPLQDKYENQLAGWSITFNVQMPNNEIDVC